MNSFKSYLLLAFIALLSCSTVAARQGTAGNAHIAALKKEVEPLVKLSLEEVAALVPAGSGIHFIGCPNCRAGAQDMGVLVWTYGMGDLVKCRFCQMTFPNTKFPNNMEHAIIAPSGAKQVYRYYQDKNGKTHYYEAHAWYERWRWIQKLSTSLAELWTLTKDPVYADRAAVILGRFAQVFPDYAVRFDYPGRPVQFFAADQKWPYQGMQPYRGAKWYWWGYNDIPIILAEVYAELQKDYDWKRMDKIIGPHTDQQIVKDLLVKGYEHTAANPETYSNMSPGMYEDMITLGRIIKEPKIAEDGLKRFQEFIKVGFFADGWWKEGTVSYHDQTINNLNNVIRSARLDSSAMPFYQKAYSVSRDAILPDGRKIPINDTWPYQKTPGKPTAQTVSRLWSALGNAAIGTGREKDQFMLNLNWSGNYGHSHYDNGSIILYAQGQELLSDLGYTHTKYRAWTTQTPSHNTVVIDQKDQDAGTMQKPATGRLMFYDDTDPHVKAVDLDASPAYSVAKTYRRRLAIIHVAPGKDYVVDRFDVEGGNTHDWFLHGNAEQEGTLEINGVTLSGNQIPAYTFLKDVKSGKANGFWTATWRYDKSGLRTYNLAEKGTQVFRFRSPSIRPAGEDDNKLDDFMRSGIMLRHTGGKSSFVALHEPFATKSWIDKVSQKGTEIVVEYRLDGKSVTDRIRMDEGSVTVRSTAGWAYSSGAQKTGSVLAYDHTDGKWRLQLDRNAPKVDFIRLDLPGGSTRYYKVAAVEGAWLQLQDDPGFTLDAGYLKFYTFPHDEYRGALKYTLFQKKL